MTDWREVNIRGKAYRVDAEWDSGDPDVGMPPGYCINKVAREDFSELDEEELLEVEDEIIEALYAQDGESYE
jgi:hypothetical protein